MHRPTSGRPLVLALAAIAGLGTMCVELSAVRLLAPWFGASLVVWTNVIGVVLLALSCGYLLGARWSRSTRPLVALAWALALGALWTGCLPWLAPFLAAALLPSGLSLQAASALIGWGSLACSLVLFLPTALLLGTAVPLCTEVLERQGKLSGGAAGGRVLACSTLGSLVGTFATSHWLLPILGLRVTFLGASALLLLASLAAAWHARASLAGAAGAASALALGLLAGGPAPSRPQPPQGWTLLEAVESPYQSVRVLEEPTLGLRSLQVNEHLDSFQSVWAPEPGLLGEGFYYDGFALPLAWTMGADGQGTPASWRSLVVGLGAGTAWRVLEGVAPPTLELRGIGIELDPAVVELGQRWMDLSLEAGASNRVVVGDGRAVLCSLDSEPGFEQVILDAYANQTEIPAHLSSVEFLDLLRERLVVGGWLCANVGGFGLDDPVVLALGATMAHSFATPVLALRLPASRNLLLLVRREAPTPEPGSLLWRDCAPLLRGLLAKLEVPHAWRWIRAQDAPLLGDDRNPIQELERLSLQEAHQRWIEERRAP